MSLLDLSTIGLQIVLPLALIGWFAFSPQKSQLGFFLQLVATGLALVALLLAAVWMVPPWWVPYVYLVLWTLAALAGSSRRAHRTSSVPQSPLAWAAVLVLGSLAAWACVVIVSAVTARTPVPGARVVDLAFPLGPGRYLVASGGASEAINGHFLTLEPTTERQRAHRGQSYGVDIVQLSAWGMRASGWRPVDPETYAIFGQTVLAPCVGTVIAALDGKPDMPVPVTDTTRLEGNHVVIRCGDVAVLLAHFQRDSVLVRRGETVVVGQPVGRVGNSGQSTEPHLHIHAQSVPESGPLLAGEPYFLTLDGMFPVRNERIVIVTPGGPAD